MRRQTVQSTESNRLVETCYPRSREGLVTKVHKGDGPARYQSLARSLATYVVSPPLALRRIDRYAGQRVTSHDRSHQSERGEQETVEVSTFIGRMVQPGCPTGFPRMRSYGVQATKPFATLKPMLHAALAQVQGISKEAIKLMAPMTSRQR
jgi:Putative transposase